MADIEHLKIIQKGVDVWNKWRDENGGNGLKPDLSRANLKGINLQDAFLKDVNLSGAVLSEGKFYQAYFVGANLSEADLRGADLSQTDLSGANLQNANLSGEETLLYNVACNGTDFCGANLSRAKLHMAHISQGAKLCGKTTNLTGADLSSAYLCGADFNGANLADADLQNADLGDDFGPVDLTGVNLSNADLFRSNFTGANLTGADLSHAFLSEANLSRADLTDAILCHANIEKANLSEANLTRTKLDGSYVFGVSAWDITLIDTQQKDLTVTSKEDESVAPIKVDNIEVAQYIHLMLCREKIRSVFDTTTKKQVLILGRFTPERKRILDGLADEVRKNELVPIIFDFERPKDRDFTETIKVLAGMSLFVIADISQPKSSPLELQATVPDYQVPFVLIIQEGEEPFSMVEGLKKYDWVLSPVKYRSLDKLRKDFKKEILDRARAKLCELQRKRTRD